MQGSVAVPLQLFSDHFSPKMFCHQSGAAVLLAALRVITSSSALYIPQGKALSRSQMLLLYEKVYRLEPRLRQLRNRMKLVERRQDITAALRRASRHGRSDPACRQRVRIHERRGDYSSLPKLPLPHRGCAVVHVHSLAARTRHQP